MRFLRCVHAEFLLVVPRLTRTRLGMTLVVLGTTLVWLSARGFDALTVTMQAGAPGAVLRAGGVAGGGTDPPARATPPPPFPPPPPRAAGGSVAGVGPAFARGAGGRGG